MTRLERSVLWQGVKNVVCYAIVFASCVFAAWLYQRSIDNPETATDPLNHLFRLGGTRRDEPISRPGSRNPLWDYRPAPWPPEGPEREQQFVPGDPTKSDPKGWALPEDKR